MGMGLAASLSAKLSARLVQDDHLASRSAKLWPAAFQITHFRVPMPFTCKVAYALCAGGKLLCSLIDAIVHDQRQVYELHGNTWAQHLPQNMHWLTEPDPAPRQQQPRVVPLCGKLAQ